MKAPFNISVIDPIEYIQRKECLPVSSHSVYESSTQLFHPDGLFSEVIFGQVGSKERLIKRGFIDLHTKLINPHLFKQWMRLKGLYKDVISGKKYAYFDKEAKDLVATTPTDPNANTGYNFFLSVIPKIQLTENDSIQRNNRIRVLKEYADRMFIDKMIVLPAGVRDVKISNGRASSDEINKIYLSLLSLAKSLPTDGTEDPLYDVIRYQMQLKIQAIYDYIINIIRGKHGFAQGKYTARAIVYSNRNVITAAITSRTPSANSPSVFSIDEIQVPLYQAMKGAVPMIVHKLNTGFFEQVFDKQSSTVSLINPETFRLEYHEVSAPELTKYTTLEGIEKIIDDFRHIEKAFDPVEIELQQPITINNKQVTKLPLYGVYDTDDEIVLFRSIEDLKDSYAKKEKYRDDNPLLAILDNIPEIQSNEEYIIEGSGCVYAFGMDIQSRDIDIVPTVDLFNRLKSRSDIETDEFGDFKLKINDIDVHIKNKIYDIKSQADWDTIKETKTVRIGMHYYIDAPTLLARYKDRNSLSDKKKITYLQSLVVDESKVRPLTYIEMCYMATYSALKDKCCTVTRYPVLNIENLGLHKIHLTSTNPSRVVQFISARGMPAITLPEYPVMSGIDKTVKQSISLHPSTLELMGADHDGDTVTLNILMSDEANKEVREYLEDPISLLTPDGKLIYNSSTKWVVPMSLLYCTCHKIKE